MSGETKTVIEPQVEAAIKEIATLVADFPPEARAAAAQALIEGLAQSVKSQLGGMFDVTHRRWAEIVGPST